MRRESSFGLIITLGCLLSDAPSALAGEMAAQPAPAALPIRTPDAALSQRVIKDRNGVVLDATAPALAYLRLGRIAADQPLQLSLDTQANKVLTDELAQGLGRFSAKAAAGFIMDVNTGEIVALSSIESNDAQNRAAAGIGNAPTNRMTQAVYEFGSSAKLMTVAMALEAGKVGMAGRIDGSELHYGKFTIHDDSPLAGMPTLPEAVIHGSNIAAGRLAQRVGTTGQKAFLEKMGQLDTLNIDGLDGVAPIYSKTWPGIYTITVAFGHGIAVSPLQAGMAVAALVNGGTLRQPTIFKQSGQVSDAAAQRVISSDTSAKMRYLLRLNAEQGTARTADVAGYFVGGMTSTAEKVVDEHYVRDRVITTFTAVFPADKPKYLVMTLLDEPHALRATHGFITAGWNAAPVAAKVIERTAPILGVEHRATLPVQALPM
jgi:cell division protein FtsI (penicillin-binding protein 3)